jgi:hypothetical protein
MASGGSRSNAQVVPAAINAVATPAIVLVTGDVTRIRHFIIADPAMRVPAAEHRDRSRLVTGKSNHSADGSYAGDGIGIRVVTPCASKI